MHHLLLLLLVLAPSCAAFTVVVPQQKQTQRGRRLQLSAAQHVATQCHAPPPAAAAVGTSRRRLLQQAVSRVATASVVAAAVGGAPISPAAAFSLNPAVGLVGEIGRYRGTLLTLLTGLKDKTIGDSDDDKSLVLRYASSFARLQNAMAEAAPLLKLSSSKDQERLATLPLAMKGHLLELEQAAKSGSSEDRVKEVEEVVETLTEFLSLAAQQVSVPAFVAPRAASSQEYYGLFGCEAWGTKAKKGSNSCEPAVKDSK